MRPDRKACEKCFNFPSIEKVRFRIRRMKRILAIENYLMETKSSETGNLEITKFLKSNVTDASPSALKLRERCKQYVSHRQWLKDHFSKLREYDVVDDSGKIYHDKWISKLSKIYHDEPAMKESLLDALIKFTLSRYDGHVNAPCSPKLIAFFQNIYALNPKFYRIFSQNFGGYHEHILRKFEAVESPEVPIVNCSDEMIKKRAKDWISKIRENNNADVLLVSDMADAAKVPPMGDFFHKCKVLDGGIHSDHCIKEDDYGQNLFVRLKWHQK